jgi:hypothetical protein
MSSLRRLLTGCFLALSAISSDAATWTPDPSLQNPALHHRLYEIGRNFGDLNFDPDANLLGGHTKSPPNKKEHSTRESAYYAYGLLMTGDASDRARANAILKRVVALEDTNPSSPTCGGYNWVAEDPRVQDVNSAAFVGLTLADIYDLDRRHPCLDPEVKASVEKATRLSVEAVMRRDVEPSYTNIALLSTALGAAGEKLWHMPGAGAWAQAKIDAVVKLIGDGEVTEYLSPTYNGVTLEGAYTAQKFSFSDAFEAKVNAMINHTWKQVALSYHAPTFQVAGPQQRSYGNNMLEYCAVLKYFIYLAQGGAYPIPDCQLDHDWDMGCLVAIADLPVTERPEFKAPPVAWREWVANGMDATHPTRHLSQYRAGNFILGTVAIQDEWKQKRNLVAYWRNPGPQPEGFRVGYCIDQSNESIPGFAGEKLHFYSQQVKDAALVAIVASTDVPGEGVSTLVFDGGAVVPETKGGSPVRIVDGTITAYLYPVSTGNPTFQNQPDPLHHLTRVTRDWNSSDKVGLLHVLSYLIVFRPSDQPAPQVSGLRLTGDATGVSTSAKVDGAKLSISFQN